MIAFSRGKYGIRCASNGKVCANESGIINDRRIEKLAMQHVLAVGTKNANGHLRQKSSFRPASDWCRIGGEVGEGYYLGEVPGAQAWVTVK